MTWHLRYVIALILICLLPSCTNKNIVEISFPNGRPNGVEVSFNDKDNVSVVPMDTKGTSHPEGNWHEGCMKNVLSSLEAIPQPPRDLIVKKKISDQELIDLLTDYALALRKHAQENKQKVSDAYARHLESCKK